MDKPAEPQITAVVPQTDAQPLAPNVTKLDDQEALKLRVALRIRPLVPREIEKECKVCVSTDSKRSQVPLGNCCEAGLSFGFFSQVRIADKRGTDKSFTYDFVYGSDSTQSQLYEGAVRPLVDGCFNGYNATVLAYGQTVRHRNTHAL